MIFVLVQLAAPGGKYHESEVGYGSKELRWAVNGSRSIVNTFACGPSTRPNSAVSSLMGSMRSLGVGARNRWCRIGGTVLRRAAE